MDNLKKISNGMKLDNLSTNLIAVCLLLFVFLVCIFSIKGDSLTMDELAHLPAGYSYLTQKDMRLNPEHPPLIKDLAGLPLLFIRGINFPSDIESWKDDVNGQWEFGNIFLFHSGNPVDKMIFWGRVSMILVLLLLGFYIFKWAREKFGNKVALLSLFLFSFSPTLLAHGRLVTTDVGAAIGAFIATYYFLKSLEQPSLKNIVFAGIAFGIAQLLKFTLVILIPFFIFLALFWWLFKSRKFLLTLKILVLVFVIGYLLVWPVYLYHVWGYPLEKQISDINVLQQNRPIPILTAALVTASKIPVLGGTVKHFITDWRYSYYLTDLPKTLSSFAKNPVLRPYSQYLNGLCLVIQRGLSGNTTYFLGEVSAAGWKSYFPVVYSVKETLPLHILTIIVILYCAWLIKKPFWQNGFGRFKNWISSHFVEFSMISFIILYWIFSFISTLNIGVRHLLPTFPFVFVLISIGIISLLNKPYLKIKCAALALLLLWQAVSVVSVFPSFLAYFNEIAGGPNGGYVYTVDSNLDWGQDLKRLKNWVDEKGIDKIYVNYFGGTDVEYYLKEKAVPWWGDRKPEELPKGSYLAVSATFLQGGRGFPVPGFDPKYNQPYLWLYQYKPVIKIGYSIFVYYID